MKLYLLASMVLIIIAIQQCDAKKNTKEDEEGGGGEDGGEGGAGGKEDFQSMFQKFFGKGKDSSKAFSDFLKESGKKMGIKKIPGAPDGAGGDDQEEDDDDKKGKNKEVPLGGKVFAFYGKTYGCTNSKVYDEFVKNYKDGKLPTPPNLEKDEKSEKWLKQLAKKDVDVTSDSKPSVEEAEQKLKKLETAQKKTLTDGEAQMPMEAQMFLKFVKEKGCQDKNVEDYKTFNALMAKEIEKNKNKKKQPPPTYYLSKAETLLKEAEEFNKGE